MRKLTRKTFIIQIQQIEDYPRNDILTKDDKAIILTALHEIKTKQNEQNKENLRTYSRRITITTNKLKINK